LLESFPSQRPRLPAAHGDRRRQKAIVQRCLRHAGVLDHAIDSDQVDAVLVEQFVRGSKQPLSG
jgi:hypothetical protein